MLGFPTVSAKWLTGSGLVFATMLTATLLLQAASQAQDALPQPPADDPFAPAVETTKTSDAATERKPTEPAETAESPEVSLSADPPGLTRLINDAPLWIDKKRKLVVLDGEVVMREGLLEMFACPKGTKEHESVVMTTCKPQFVHAALLALGLKPGSGAKFDPMYIPAKGPIVDIFVLWKDSEGKDHKVRAQDWIQSLKTEKAMEFDWVFAGSGFWKDEDTGESHYQADGGDFICVSNFPTAMLDLPVPSSQSNDALNFTAFTANIPPRGTKVRLVLRPRELPTEQQKKDATGEVKEESKDDTK